MMSSAYILAERRIIEDAAEGIDTTGHLAEAEKQGISFEFEVGAKSLTDKELLYEKAVEVRKQLDEAINNDDFESAKALQELLNVIEKKYNRLL